MRDRKSEWSRNRTSDFKIDKNVKIVEIDHNGACLCGHEVSDILYRYKPGLEVNYKDRKNVLSNCQQKWHFLFVSTKSLFIFFHHQPSKLKLP